MGEWNGSAPGMSSEWLEKTMAWKFCCELAHHMLVVKSTEELLSVCCIFDGCGECESGGADSCGTCGDYGIASCESGDNGVASGGSGDCGEVCALLLLVFGHPAATPLVGAWCSVLFLSAIVIRGITL